MAKKKTNKWLWIVLVIAALFIFSKGEFKFMGAATASDKINRAFSRTDAYTNENIVITYSPSSTAIKYWDVSDPIPSGWTVTLPTVYMGQSGGAKIESGSLNMYSASEAEGSIATSVPVTWKTPSSAGTHSFTGTWHIDTYSGSFTSQSITVTQCAGSGGAETCNNIDDDCDHSIDESLSQSCYTGPSGTQNVGLCIGGTQICSTGSWGTCNGQVVPVTENAAATATCGDGKDNDCDGTIDENQQTKADINPCNGKVAWSEFTAYAQGWLGGTYAWASFTNVAQKWVSGEQLP